MPLQFESQLASQGNTSETNENVKAFVAYVKKCMFMCVTDRTNESN